MADRAGDSDDRLMRLIFEQSNSPILLLDLERENVIEANPSACQMLGYSRQELLASPISAVHPQDMPTLLEFGERVLQNGSGKIGKLTCLTKTGRQIPVEYSAAAIEANGRACLHITVSDVTHHMIGEDALRIRDRALASTSNGVLITDPRRDDNPIVYCNAAFRNMTGYSDDQILGRNCRFLQNGDTDQEVLAEVREAIREHRGCRVTLRNYRQNGQMFWNELTLSPVFDGQDELTHFVGIQNDITERRRAEDALGESEEQYRILLDNHVDAIELTVDGMIVYANEQMTRLTGYSPEELIGQAPQQLIVVEDRHRAVEQNEQFADGAESKQYEYELHHKNGDTLTVEFVSHGIQYRGRAAVLSVLRDVSARTRIRQKLRRADRLASTGTLAAGIAHELNNPISAAWAAAVSALTLKDKTDSDEQLAEALNAVIRSIKRCDQIIQGVLRFSRNQPSHRSEQDINEIVRRAREMSRRFAEQRDTQFVFILSDGIPPLTVNPVEIEQAIVNLLHNAIEASSGTPEVSVRTYFQNDTICVAVKDKGRGISVADQAKMFDPFYTARTDGSGIGLGLSLTYGIIEEHGGAIDVKSRVGEGTTMTIQLPLIGLEDTR